MSTNIIVFGGTGVIGKYITQALLNDKSCFGRIAIFTSAATVENKAALLERWKKQGLDVITGDLTNDEDVVEAYKDFDTVVSAVGRNVIAEQINLIKLAEASSTIQRFFPSEYGTDIEYWAESAHEKPHQQKLKVRAYIDSNVKRLDYTYLVTGPYADLFMAKVKNPRMGTFDATSKSAVLLGDGKGKISLTTMQDVGKLLVAALKHPEQSRNRALKVNSFTTTPHEIVTEYEKQTGGKQWTVSYTSLENLKKLEQEAWDHNDPLATPFTLRRIWIEGGTLYDSIDNDKIGAQDLDTLPDMIATLLHAQK